MGRWKSSFRIQPRASRHARRQLLRWGEKLLPRRFTHTFIRNSIRLPSTLGEVRFKLAETKEELEAAFRILHDAYVESGFIRPAPSGLYLSLQHALPSTSTLIATVQSQVIGTVTLVRDNPFGLPLERAFNTGDLRRTGERVAEVSSLAIHRDFRREFGGQTLFPLFCYLYRYAVQYYGLQYFVIAVYPHHAAFYEAIFGFRPLEKKIVTNYLGAPAAAVYLDLHSAPVFTSFHYGEKPAEKNIHEFFAKKEFAEFLFPERPYGKISDPVLTPECLDYFFNRRTDIFSKMSAREAKILLNYYKDPRYGQVLPSAAFSEWQRAERFEVDLKGRIEFRGPQDQSFVSMRVLDVSRDGFRAVLNREIRFSDRVKCKIALNDFDSVELSAVSKWRRDGLNYGFQIVESCPRWEVFINFLTSDLYKTEKQAG